MTRTVGLGIHGVEKAARIHRGEDLISSKSIPPALRAARSSFVGLLGRAAMSFMIAVSCSFIAFYNNRWLIIDLDRRQWFCLTRGLDSVTEFLGASLIFFGLLM